MTDRNLTFEIRKRGIMGMDRSTGEIYPLEDGENLRRNDDILLDKLQARLLETIPPMERLDFFKEDVFNRQQENARRLRQIESGSLQISPTLKKKEND
jgi:hypothetical protein